MLKTVAFKCFVYESRRRKKVVGEFVCDKILKSERSFAWESPFPDQRHTMTFGGYETCLTVKGAMEYIKSGGTAYGWHISDLKIYDEPKELSEFFRLGPITKCFGNCVRCEYWKRLRVNAHEYDYDCEIQGKIESKIPLTKPPQSWYYVEGGVLISIRPEWWDLIASGEKTIEVRKSCPKKHEEMEDEHVQ